MADISIIDDARQAHVEETEEIVDTAYQNILGEVDKCIGILRDIKIQNTFNGSTLAQMANLSRKQNPQQTDQIMQARKALFQAYHQIQRIREIITGQKLIYHLYITGPGNYINGIEVGSDDLENFLSFEGGAIRISETEVRKAIINNEQKLIEDSNKIPYTREELYRVVMDRTHRATHTTAELYLLRNESNTGFIKKIKQKGRGKKRRTIQLSGPGSNTTFNLGHITEGIDTTMSYIERQYEQNSQLQLSMADYLTIFYHYIRQDTVSGFKGGDNPFINAQVKANHAQLMAYTTIEKAMNTLINFRSAIQSKSGIAKARAAVYKLYSAKGTEIDKITNNSLDMFLDDFIGTFGYR